MLKTKYIQLLALVMLILFLLYRFFLQLDVGLIEKHMLSVHNSLTEKPYLHNLCVLTRVKDVSYLLPQWIEYHLVAGVDHIFIANDCANDQGKTLYWADYYQSSSHLTLYLNQSFNNCSNHLPKESKLFDFLFEKAKPLCKWISIIDADEYVFPTHSERLAHCDANFDAYNFSISSLRADKRHYLISGPPHKECEPPLQNIINRLDASMLRMPWYVMSTNGNEHRPKGLLLDCYRNGNFLNVRKTLVRSRYVSQWFDSHRPIKLHWDAPYVGSMKMRDFSRPFFLRQNEMQTILVSVNNSQIR